MAGLRGPCRASLAQGRESLATIPNLQPWPPFLQNPTADQTSLTLNQRKDPVERKVRDSTSIELKPLQGVWGAAHAPHRPP